MPLVRHFFPEGEERSRVLPPITPGTFESVQDLSLGSLPRWILARCAADDSSAVIESFVGHAAAIDGPNLYLPVEIDESEFEMPLEPGEEMIVPIVTVNFGAGDLLFRMDITKRFKRISKLY